MFTPALPLKINFVISGRVTPQIKAVLRYIKFCKTTYALKPVHQPLIALKGVSQSILVWENLSEIYHTFHFHKTSMKGHDKKGNID